MPHDQKNSIYHFHTERGKGIAISVIVHVILVAFLVFAGITSIPPKAEEGLLVNFGTDEIGYGSEEPSLASYQEPAPREPLPRPEITVPDKAINTQDHEEAAEVKKVKQTDTEAEKKKKEDLEAEKKRLAELEAERKQQELEKKRKEEEERREQEIRDITKKALTAAEAKNTNVKSEGDKAGTTGNQGVKTGTTDSKVRGEGTGTGTGKGPSYSLEGRRPVDDYLPKPESKYEESGIIVIKIIVNSKGEVVSAEYRQTGSTSINEQLIKLAREAALKARFEAKPGADLQTGTITYIFTR